MKKEFKVENLDCANCANKLERDISKIKGVEEVVVNFMMSKLQYEVKEEKEIEVFEKISKKAKKVSKKIELIEW